MMTRTSISMRPSIQGSGREDASDRVRVMEYVEVHPAGTGFQIRFVPRREVDGPFVSNAAFLGPVLGELGVRQTGPWEQAFDENGASFQRAVIIS